MHRRCFGSYGFITTHGEEGFTRTAFLERGDRFLEFNKHILYSNTRNQTGILSQYQTPYDAILVFGRDKPSMQFVS